MPALLPVRSVARCAALFAALLAALLAAPAAHAGTWTDTEYWRAADRLQERIEPYWRPRFDLYKVGDLSADTMVNANMLLVHSIAALHGHLGLARQDDRAAVIAARLLQSPPFVAGPNKEAIGQVHGPGWLGATSTFHAIQHLIVDAETAEALAAAWRARDVLGLSPDLSALIAQRLREVARGSFWRYPTIRLNQINWYAQIYAAAAETNNDPSFLSRDLRSQASRFIRGVLHPHAGQAGNLGPGMHFYYVPDRSPAWPLNFDSPEYANLVASFARTWDWARQAGMPDLSSGEKAIYRRWMTRVLAGYWTHAGYLNWDTGFGFRRLHQAKKLPLAQEGLLAIAAGGDLTPGPVYARWAKSILDRGISLYERWLPADGGLPPALLFDLSERPQPAPHAVLAASRVAANAARAVQAGLGSRRSVVPPPLYAWDPDNGRLAVTTPSYNTAIVSSNQKAFPYGGVDIARLFDRHQEVAGSIGGVPPAAFGMVVRDASGHSLLATQRPESGGHRGAPAVRLVRAPSGAGVSPRSAPTRAFAGSFRVLETAARVHRGRETATAGYVFRSRTIDARWSWNGEGRARRSVELRFPSWKGDGEAHIWAIAPAGWTREIINYRTLGGVRWFYVQSEHSGYAVVPRQMPATARARMIQPARQSSAPRPGRTLVIELAHRTRKQALRGAVRLIPAPDLATAKRLVAQLG
jgi:hypothetical protein